MPAQRAPGGRAAGPAVAQRPRAVAQQAWRSRSRPGGRAAGPAVAQRAGGWRGGGIDRDRYPRAHVRRRRNPVSVLLVGANPGLTLYAGGGAAAERVAFVSVWRVDWSPLGPGR